MKRVVVSVLSIILMLLQIYVPDVCYAKSHSDIKSAVNTSKTSNVNILDTYTTFFMDQLPDKEELDDTLNSCVELAKEQNELKLNYKARYTKLLLIHKSAPQEVREKTYDYWLHADQAVDNPFPDYEKANEYLDKIEKFYNAYNSTADADKTSQTETTTDETAEPELNHSYAYIDVSNIEQNPELPTGCEAVSATIVLNYYGAGMSKTELVDNYLPYSDSPYSGFVGSPYEQPNGHGHWCAAAPIVTAMNSAIAAHGMSCTAVNISGSNFDTLLDYVANGHPVVFWGFENMSSGYHTLALIGYDTNSNICYFADPLKSGIQQYNMDATRNAYSARGKQAVVIQ